LGDAYEGDAFLLSLPLSIFRRQVIFARPTLKVK